jgi:hypothetical protein
LGARGCNPTTPRRYSRARAGVFFDADQAWGRNVDPLNSGGLELKAFKQSGCREHGALWNGTKPISEPWGSCAVHGESEDRGRVVVSTVNRQFLVGGSVGICSSARSFIVGEGGRNARVENR